MRPFAPRRLWPACAAALLIAVSVAACTGKSTTRGNTLDAEKIAEIQTGVQTRDEVAKLLGTPSSVATFDKNTWYYIGKRTEKLAFFHPDIKEQNILMVKFGDDGIVQEIKRYGLKDAREIEPVARATPTRGYERGIVETLYQTLLAGPGGILGGGGEQDPGNAVQP